MIYRYSQKQKFTQLLQARFLHLLNETGYYQFILYLNPANQLPKFGFVSANIDIGQLKFVNKGNQVTVYLYKYQVPVHNFAASWFNTCYFRFVYCFKIGLVCSMFRKAYINNFFFNDIPTVVAMFIIITIQSTD